MRHPAQCVDEIQSEQDSSRDIWPDKSRDGKQSDVDWMLSHDRGHRHAGFTCAKVRCGVHIAGGQS